jgi:hypothetical protein
MSATRIDLDRALDRTGEILDLLAPLLAVTPDARLLRLTAAIEAVGELQERLYELRDPL